MHMMYRTQWGIHVLYIPLTGTWTFAPSEKWWLRILNETGHGFAIFADFSGEEIGSF